MRTVVAATLLAALTPMVSATTASADMAPCGKKLERTYSKLWHKVDRRSHKGSLRRDAAGRNIRRWGVKWRGITFHATCPELRRSRAQLRILDSAPDLRMLVRTAVNPRQPPSDVYSGGATAGPVLEGIASCESGGNPSTNTGNGFYGKYQFDLGTWGSVGGSGLPSNASESEQDRRAAMLYAQRGAAPWPVCGR